MSEYIERSKVAEMLNAVYEYDRLAKHSAKTYLDAAQKTLMFLPGTEVEKVKCEGWININDRPPEDGQLAAILTVFRGATPGRMVARYLPKRFPNNPWTLMHGEIVYYWAPLSEVPGEEWEDVINGETIHKD